MWQSIYFRMGIYLQGYLIIQSGERIVEFDYEYFEDILDDIGQIPVPPYIKKTLKQKIDQTVYARQRLRYCPSRSSFTKELKK